MLMARHPGNAGTRCRGAFVNAALLSAGLALLPSCAGSSLQMPLTEAAPGAAQVPEAPDRAPRDPKTACVPAPGRKEDAAGRVTETKAVAIGDYAIEDSSIGVLKVVKVDDESVGLSFLGSRNSVWPIQYGQDSMVGGPSSGIIARAELCSGGVAKLTITYQAGTTGNAPDLRGGSQ